MKIQSFSVVVGDPQNLFAAQGEDIEVRFTFGNLAPDGTFTPVDLTGAQAVTLNVRDKLGQLLFARLGTVIGSPTGGAVKFTISQTDTATQAPQVYDCDVTWVDVSGYRAQLLILSSFVLGEGVGEPGDAVTVPPPVPAFGLSSQLLLRYNPPTRVNIYVRPTGSDTTGDGSFAKPYFTRQFAIRQIPLSHLGYVYYVDITGKFDAEQVDLPPFFATNPLGFTPPNGAASPHYFFEGYVNIQAAPVVLDTLNPGTTTTAVDPASGLLTITDTSKNWTVNAFKGKWLGGSGFYFSFGSIKSNTATQIVVASTLAFGTLTINDYGGSFLGVTGGPYALGVNGVKAAVAISGVQITHPDAFTPAISGVNFDELQLQACEVKDPSLIQCQQINFYGCHVVGENDPTNTDDVTLSNTTFALSFIDGITPTMFGRLVIATAHMVNCLLLDTRAGDSIQAALRNAWLVGTGLSITGGQVWNVQNLRIDNAVASAHCNPNGSAIVCFGGGSLNFMEGVIGGSGNAGYGLELVSGGQAFTEVGEPCTFTVAGVLGELKVGSMPVRTWVDFAANAPIGSQADQTHMARLGLATADSSPAVYRDTVFTTAARPTTNLVIGSRVWDSSLGKPIWWNGSVWKDAVGNTV